MIPLKLCLFVLPCGAGNEPTSKQELERENWVHLLAAGSQLDHLKLEEKGHSFGLSHIQWQEAFFPEYSPNIFQRHNV